MIGIVGDVNLRMGILIPGLGSAVRLLQERILLPVSIEKKAIYG